MKSFIAITATAGLVLTAIGAVNLKRSNEGAGLGYHHNPLAIHESAYGMLLAELSQNTVDQVWHLGIEQVNPASHGHGGDDDHEGHDHGPGEDCESCKKADEAKELLDRVTSAAPPKIVTTKDDHGHQGHSHAPGEECETCKKADQALKLLDSVTSTGDGKKEDDDHKGHDHAAHAEHDDHSSHDHAAHADHHGHDHGSKGVSLTEAITAAKDFLVELKSAGYERTNPTAVSEAHKKHIAAEIEQMLLRSYKMDPTNYGVYNAYYLFLTAHELRSSPAAFEHARMISHHTIARAQTEKTAPGPWLTAEMALLNLFLLDQHEWREKGIDPPVEKLVEYRNFSAYCKQQFEVLKQRAIADGRWETVSTDKRQEMDERQYFARKTFEQFDVLIARHSQPRVDPVSGLPNVLPQLPVASSPDPEADDRNNDD